jgi:hypothetical protein
MSLALPESVRAGDGTECAGVAGDYRSIRAELEEFHKIQEMLEELHALGVRRPGYNLASPYERHLCATS